MTFVDRSTIKPEVERAYVNTPFCFKSVYLGIKQSFVLFTVSLSSFLCNLVQGWVPRKCISKYFLT